MATAEPHRLFAQAEAFRDASHKLLPGSDAGLARLAPYIANSVLALELYLKCLLMLSKGKYPHVHSVLALFYDLPDDEIERLRKLHRGVYRAHHPHLSDGDAGAGSRDRAVDASADAALEHILRGAKDAFQIARYIYEREEQGPEGIPDVTVVSDVVRGRILTMAPELRT